MKKFFKVKLKQKKQNFINYTWLMDKKRSPGMAKNSQNRTAKAASVSPNGDWTMVPKKTRTTKHGSSTSKSSSRSHRSKSFFRKNGGSDKEGRKLFTRVTKKVFTTSNVVKFVFRAEKRAFAVKAAKSQPAVIQAHQCLTLDVLQEFRAEEKKMDSQQKKAVKATPSPTSSSVKKNRLSNKVVVNVPSVVTCRLKLVENKDEISFFLIIGGHFLTKKQGQEASDAAFAILQKEIATATKKADDANAREAAHAEARQIAKDRRAPRRKTAPRKQSKSSTSVTTFALDEQDFPTMRGEYSTDAKSDAKSDPTILDSDDAEFPEPDELFVNILEDVSESPVQLEKAVCSNKVSDEEVIVNSDDLATKDSLRIAHLEEQLKIMQAFIHQMTVPAMIQ